MIVKGVILAGGKIKGELKEITGVENKAFIKIAEKEIIDYTIEALQKANNVKEFIIVGEEEKLENKLKDKLVKIIPAKETMLENIFSAIEYYKGEDKILFLGADAPLINSIMIDDFLEECKKKEADIYYPIIEKKLNEEKFLGMKRTYARLKEGTFTGGNMFLLNPEVLISFKELLEEVIGSRKSVIKLLKILGFIFIVKFLLRRLAISDTEKRVGEILKGYKMIAVICKNPEVGVDIDKISDLEIVKGILEKK